MMHWLAPVARAHGGHYTWMSALFARSAHPGAVRLPSERVARVLTAIGQVAPSSRDRVARANLPARAGRPGRLRARPVRTDEARVSSAAACPGVRRARASGSGLVDFPGATSHADASSCSRSTVSRRGSNRLGRGARPGRRDRSAIRSAAPGPWAAHPSVQLTWTHNEGRT